MSSETLLCGMFPFLPGGFAQQASNRCSFKIRQDILAVTLSGRCEHYHTNMWNGH